MHKLLCNKNKWPVALTTQYNISFRKKNVMTHQPLQHGHYCTRDRMMSTYNLNYAHTRTYIYTDNND